MDWVWTLTDKQMDAFYEALNQPPRDMPKLKALFERSSPFDQKEV